MIFFLNVWTLGMSRKGIFWSNSSYYSCKHSCMQNLSTETLTYRTLSPPSVIVFSNRRLSIIVFSRGTTDLFTNFWKIYLLHVRHGLNTVYVTFWRPKLRGQFSENLVLWIYEFLFNFGDGISKEKKIMEVPRIENLKYDRNFQLTAYLINTLLFVCNKQTSENRSAEAAIKIGVPREKN